MICFFIACFVYLLIVLYILKEYIQQNNIDIKGKIYKSIIIVLLIINNILQYLGGVENGGKKKKE